MTTWFQESWQISSNNRVTHNENSQAPTRLAGSNYRVTAQEPKGLQGIKVLLPVLELVDVVCASRTRFVTDSL